MRAAPTEEEESMPSKERNNNELTRRELLRLAACAAAAAGLAAWPAVARAAGMAESVQVIDLLPTRRLATISPGIFGNLIETYGSGLDGIWVGEDSSIPNDGGLRLDTIEAFRQLQVSVIRWPGGTLADTYHWQDGIGPRSQRPRTWNYFFGGEQTNHFGTDEFLRFCELVGAEAWIKINPITATLGDTVKWMQYCNYAGNTDWSDLRRQNGHPQPYGVKYWSIGNETSPAFSPEEYADRVFEWSYYMRMADRHSRIVVSGNAAGDWNQRFLAQYVKLRKDATVFLELKDMFHVLGLKYANEEQVRRAAALVDGYLGPKAVEISVEEWQAQSGSVPPWPRELAELPVWEGLLRASEMNLTYEGIVRMDAAVSAASQIHGFIRNADRVKLASFLYPTNMWGPLIKTDGPRLLRTANYHVFDMLKQHMGADSIGPEFDRASGLDVVASVSAKSQKTTVSIVNPNESEPVEARLRIKGAEGSAPNRASAVVLTGGPNDENTFEAPERIKPRVGSVQRKGEEWVALCPPYSLTVVTLEPLTRREA